MTCIREKATLRALSFVSICCCNCALENGSPVCTPAMCGEDNLLVPWSSLSDSCRTALVSCEPGIERGVAKPCISLGSICIFNHVLLRVRIFRMVSHRRGKKATEHIHALQWEKRELFRWNGWNCRWNSMQTMSCSMHQSASGC
jgi:hypothetical protein